MIKVTTHDDGTATVALPAYLFEVLPKGDDDRALVEEILERVREELEDHFELSAGFIESGAPANAPAGIA